MKQGGCEVARGVRAAELRVRNTRRKCTPRHEAVSGIAIQDTRVELNCTRESIHNSET